MYSPTGTATALNISHLILFCHWLISLSSHVRYACEARVFTSKQRIVAFVLDKWKPNSRKRIKWGR